MTDFKVALVTGASSGIGRAIAQYLAVSGSKKIYLVARNEEELKATALTAPDIMEPMPTDLSKTKDLNALRSFVSDQTIDLLVNNAGIANFTLFEKQSSVSINQMLQVNIVALTHLCHSVIPQMIERKSGDILNVSSIAGSQPLPNENLYAATKAFVTNFSQGLRSELKEHNVNVTALLPGLVRTNLFEVAGSTESLTSMPNFMWMDPPKVAEIAIRAVKNKKAIVTPGGLNKVISGMVDATPRPALRAFSSKVMKLRAKGLNQPE